MKHQKSFVDNTLMGDISQQSLSGMVQYDSSYHNKCIQQPITANKDAQKGLRAYFNATYIKNQPSQKLKLAVSNKKRKELVKEQKHDFLKKKFSLSELSTKNQSMEKYNILKVSQPIYNTKAKNCTKKLYNNILKTCETESDYYFDALPYKTSVVSSRNCLSFREIERNDSQFSPKKIYNRQYSEIPNMNRKKLTRCSTSSDSTNQDKK